VDLDPASEPHAGDVVRGGGERDRIVAVRDQPDVGRRVVRPRLLDRLGAMLSNPGHERHAQIGHMAAERTVAEEAGPVLRVHLAQSEGEGVQRLAALLG
jgi:hypothetical protein